MFTTSCADLVLPAPSAPRVADGAIDLRAWDFEHDGAVRLDGAWDFFWQTRALAAPDVATRTASERRFVPGFWSSGPQDDDELTPDQGFATYRLRLRLPARRAPLWITHANADTSYRMFGQPLPEGVSPSTRAGPAEGPIIESGVVGQSRREEQPLSRQAAGALPDGVDVVLLLEVSNFHYAHGGAGYEFWLGTRDEIAKRRADQRARDFFLAGLIGVIGLYQLVLFALRRSERAPLWFGLFCLMLSLRTIERGRYLEELFAAWQPWAAAKRVEFICFYAAALVFTLYIDAVIGGARWPRIRWLFVVAFSALTAVVICTPVYLFSWTPPIAELITLLSFVWMSCELFRALARPQADRSLWLVLGGFVAMAAAVTLDILVNEGVMRTPLITPAGQALFVVAQAFVIAKGNARARATAERLSHELLQVSRLKDEFLANTSHELRTPLHGVIGLGQALLDGARGPLTVTQSADVTLVVQSARRLSSLINDILDFEKIKHRELSLRVTPVDIHSIADVVVTFSRTLARPGVALMLDVPEGLPLVAGDEARLQQILFNLVGNAVKFTHSGEVRVSAAQEGDALVVRVHDTGIGIAADRQATLFRDDAAADVTNKRGDGGAGLGLSITRRLVELHCGRLQIDSDVGRGSTFSFSLPLFRDDATAAAGSDHAPALSGRDQDDDELHPGRDVPGARETAVKTSGAGNATMHTHEVTRPADILIVDDDPVNLRVLDAALQGTRHRVHMAASGPEALALVDDGLKPDIVLLDVMMPRMSGYAVVAKLRERWPSHLLPVVLLTAKGQTSDVIDGFSAGANDYMIKPIGRAELLARIDTHLQLSRMSAAAGRFVPYEFLEILHKRSLVDVKRGDHVRKEMSILFSDIRSFTTILEGLNPAQSFAFINEYLTRMEVPIRAHGGFIDKYIGDAIMALFDGSPDDAVRAGIGKLQALSTYNRERVARGQRELHIGIGIHTGPLMLGTIGGATRLNCGVIGDAVNLAARVEGMTKMYGASLLVSDSTFHGLADTSAYSWRVVDRVRAKGKTTPVTIIEILDGSAPALQDQKRTTLPRFREAIDLYARGAFVDAGSLFAECLRSAPDDVALTLYRDRCEALAVRPPDEGWDGVFELTTK